MWSPDRREKVSQHQELLRKRALTAPSNKNKGYADEAALPPVRGAATNTNSSSNDVSGSSTAAGVSYAFTARSLAQKVRVQRLERLQRQQQESELQARVNDHLVSVLAQHKERKRAQMDRWKEHAAAPLPPPPRPPAVVRERMREEAAEVRRREERRQQARDGTRLRLGRSGIASALTSPLSAGLMTPTASGLGTSPADMALNSEAAKADARHAAAFAEVTQIYETILNPQTGALRNTTGAKTRGGAGGDDVDGSVSAMLSDFIPGSIADLTEQDDYGPMLVGLSPEQKQRLMEIDAKQRKIRAKVAAKHAMLEQARQRRAVATQRIKDDPPADVLVQADLRRYIPADLLEAMPGSGSLPPGFDAGALKSNPGGPSFFLTDVDAEKKRHEQDASTSTAAAAAAAAASSNKKSSKKAGTRSKAQAHKEGTAKSRALQGGPLEIGSDNNRRMSIFAREVLMKVSTAQRMRHEIEKAKMENEERLIASRRELLGHDEDDEFSSSAPAGAASSSTATAAGGGAASRRHAPTGLDPEEERRAAVEWYRRYHQPLVQGGNVRGVGRQGVMKDWRANHKPLEHLPMPSRTLFFESERPKSPLRRSLF